MQAWIHKVVEVVKKVRLTSEGDFSGSRDGRCFGAEDEALRCDLGTKRVEYSGRGTFGLSILLVPPLVGATTRATESCLATGTSNRDRSSR